MQPGIQYLYYVILLNIQKPYKTKFLKTKFSVFNISKQDIQQSWNHLKTAHHITGFETCAEF